MTEMLKCRGCGKHKPAREFPRNAGGGRRSFCRDCTPKLETPAWKLREFAAARQRRAAIREAQARRQARERQSGLLITPAGAETKDEAP